MALKGEDKEIINLTEIVTEHNYTCSFRYGNCDVQFRFREKEDIRKSLTFWVNGKRYTRHQIGTPDSYRVFINKKEMPDPFEVYIKKFINGDSNLKTAYRITELMGEILL